MTTFTIDVDAELPPFLMPELPEPEATALACDAHTPIWNGLLDESAARLAAVGLDPTEPADTVPQPPPEPDPDEPTVPAPDPPDETDTAPPEPATEPDRPEEPAEGEPEPEPEPEGYAPPPVAINASDDDGDAPIDSWEMVGWADAETDVEFVGTPEGAV